MTSPLTSPTSQKMQTEEVQYPNFFSALFNHISMFNTDSKHCLKSFEKFFDKWQVHRESNDTGSDGDGEAKEKSFQTKH